MGSTPHLGIVGELTLESQEQESPYGGLDSLPLGHPSRRSALPYTSFRTIELTLDMNHP